MTQEQLQQEAEKYAETKFPFVWPKNKHGEDMVQRVGHANPPFSRKHREKQSEISTAFISGGNHIINGELAEANKKIEELRKALNKISYGPMGEDIGNEFAEYATDIARNALK